LGANDVSKIIVALDRLEISHALNLASLLSGHVWGFKVNDLLLEYGCQIIPWLGVHGNVFADAKLHDIPQTMVHGVQVLADAGADLITVHMSAGQAALEAVLKHRGKPGRIGTDLYYRRRLSGDLRTFSWGACGHDGGRGPAVAPGRPGLFRQGTTDGG
jgi:orotidine-5'-phosphate decarboxylase